jgi:glycogen debranching enzyme
MQVGYVDSTLWYIVGVTEVAKVEEDRWFWEEMKESVKKALRYLQCLELNGRGLLYVPAGGDWADEYVFEGYILFDQCLYLWAQENYLLLCHDPWIEKFAKRLRRLIKVNYYPTHADVDSGYVYHPALFADIAQADRPVIPIACFSPTRTWKTIDLFAISLLMKLDILDDEEKNACEMEIRKRIGYSTEDNLYPAFSPTITEQDADWLDLRRNYSFRFKNKPGEYHNGGLWPLVHGWYLSQKDSCGNDELQRFADTIHDDDYNFSEHYHAETDHSSKVKGLGYSAAGFIFASRERRD